MKGHHASDCNASFRTGFGASGHHLYWRGVPCTLARGVQQRRLVCSNRILFLTCSSEDPWPYPRFSRSIGQRIHRVYRTESKLLESPVFHNSHASNTLSIHRYRMAGGQIARRALNCSAVPPCQPPLSHVPIASLAIHREHAVLQIDSEPPQYSLCFPAQLFLQEIRPTSQPTQTA